jgi:hypothetical protein
VELLALVGPSLELHLIGQKPGRFLRAPAGAAEDEALLPAIETGSELPFSSLVEMLDEPVSKLEDDGPIFGCALQEIDSQPVGEVLSVLEHR